jgi:hypothetical protein
MRKKESSASTSTKTSQQHNNNIVIEDKRAVPILNKDVEYSIDTYLDNIQREKFYKLCTDSNVDLKILFSKPLTLKEKHNFNIFIRLNKEKHNIKILESLIYIESELVSFNQLVKYLDQENIYIAKTEAQDYGSKYKITNNKLKEFMEFEKN